MGHKASLGVINCKTGLLLLFSLTLVFSATAVGPRIWKNSVFFRNKETGVVLVESLRDRRPTNIPVEAWDVAVNWTKTAYANVFFSADTPGSSDIRSFTQDATGIINENEGFEAIQRLWERLAQSGPTGEIYVAKFYPDLLHDYSYHMDNEKVVHSSPEVDSSQDKSEE